MIEGLVSWSAKKQPVVSRSSTKSEYRALSITTCELFWLYMLFKELGVPLPVVPVIWCDNISALALASNPVFHARTKHIEVDYHFVREKVVNGDILIKFISTNDQIADIFTKGLSTARFHFLKSKLMIEPPLISLRGDVSDTSLAITHITKVIPKDHAEKHAASQHDTYAANHAHSAKETYAITTNHAVESNATNAGIITDHATYPAYSEKGKYTAIQCDLPTTTRKANYHHSSILKKARPAAPLKERSLLNLSSIP